MHYQNPQFDTMCDQVIAELDVPTRTKLLQQLQGIMVNDVACIG